MTPLETGILITAGSVFALAAMWIAYEAWNAPEGWEDADGFHLGRKPDGEG